MSQCPTAPPHLKLNLNLTKYSIRFSICISCFVITFRKFRGPTTRSDLYGYRNGSKAEAHELCMAPVGEEDTIRPKGVGTKHVGGGGGGQMYKPLFQLSPSSVLPSPPSPLFHSLPLFLLPLPSLPPLLPLLYLQRKRLHKSSAMTEALYHKSPGGVKAQRAVEGERSKTESRSQSEMLRLQRTSQHIDTLLTDQH